MSKPNLATGRKVWFVGGPQAGNVRKIPEGDDLVNDGDFIYRIFRYAMPGDQLCVYIAYAANQPPIHALVDMWREYSEVAQIKRGITDEGKTYNKLQPISG